MNPRIFFFFSKSVDLRVTPIVKNHKIAYEKRQVTVKRHRTMDGRRHKTTNDKPPHNLTVNSAKKKKKCTTHGPTLDKKNLPSGCPWRRGRVADGSIQVADQSQKEKKKKFCKREGPHMPERDFKRLHSWASVVPGRADVIPGLALQRLRRNQIKAADRKGPQGCSGDNIATVVRNHLNTLKHLCFNSETMVKCCLSLEELLLSEL